MPHFMLKISPTGPTVQVAVMVSGARRKVLEESGDPIPEPQRIIGLIDTGASISGVDPSVLAALNLSPTGEAEIHTPSTKGNAVKADTYDVQIGIYAGRPGDLHFISDTIQVTATVMTGQSVQALIGTDILRSCIFIYNGADEFYTLAY
jgi:hypothetical protein